MIRIPRRTETCQRFKADGGLVAAVLPIHYPRALLRAFHVLPIEVWGPPKVDVSYGGAHLQPYVCSIVHNALSFLKAGGLDQTDIILVPHTCDSLQGLGSILIDYVRPRQPVFPFYLPRARRPEDVDFLTEEFRSLYENLAEVTGRRPTSEELWAAIRREEAADQALVTLYRHRRKLDLGNRDFYRLVRAREFVPAEVFTELVQETFSRARLATERDGGVPVILSGIVPEPMDVLDAIEEMGGVVVADDLACCGRRLYSPGQSKEPLRYMAEQILFGPPDVTRGTPIEERAAHLLRLAETTGARGIIFYDVKFCEPELFDLPDLRRRLKEAGLPSVNIEVDISDPLPHQTITRIGAFLEVLE